MARTIFPSLAAPEKRCFVFDSSPDNFRAQVDPCMSQYDTYGDGTTAHTPDYGINREAFVDWCHSLADWIGKNPDAVEHAGMAWRLEPLIRKNDMEFAATVRFKNKRQWYSLKELKVTSSDKTHDRRYFEVTEHHNGDHVSMNMVLGQSTDSAFQHWARRLEIREYLGSTGHYPPMPLLGSAEASTTDEVAVARDQMVAFQNLQRVLDAALRFSASKEIIERYTTRIAAPAPIQPKPMAIAETFADMELEGLAALVAA